MYPLSTFVESFASFVFYFKALKHKGSQSAAQRNTKEKEVRLIMDESSGAILSNEALTTRP
jgi:hypothetical protein